MASSITKAPRNPKTPARPPLKDDGSLYPLSMLLPGHYRYAWGDSNQDLVSVLAAAPDYPDWDDQDQLITRIRCALHLQVTTQARINASAMVTGRWDQLCEWERRVLNGPRHIAPNMPDGFPSRDLFNGMDVWTAVDTPLVVLTTSCEPLNPGVPPILGTEENLWVIDSIDDDALLTSLADLGIVRLFRLPAPM